MSLSSFSDPTHSLHWSSQIVRTLVDPWRCHLGVLGNGRSVTVCVSGFLSMCARTRARATVSFLPRHSADRAHDVTLLAAASNARQQQPPPPQPGDWLALLISSLLRRGKGQWRPQPSCRSERHLLCTRCHIWKETWAPGRRRLATLAWLVQTARQGAGQRWGAQRAPPQNILATWFWDLGSTLPSQFSDFSPSLISPKRSLYTRRRCRSWGNQDFPGHPRCAPLENGGPSAL